MAGIILNDDFMRFVNSKYHENYVFCEVGEKDIREYIRKLEGTTVTDFVFNVNAQLSYSPSELWMTAEEKYNTTEEKGHPVNFKDSFYKVWYDIFVLQKLDMYSIWIEELKGININPWISFRINDTHDNHIEYGGIRRAPFFEGARRRGITRTNHREKVGYYDDCLDFKHEEVRRYNLDYIREQLNRYDVYGVEIDYMREPYICSPGEEDLCREIMHGFFSEIKGIIADAEERYSHKIKLSVRCFRDAAATFDAGLDIFRLIREGLIDLVIPTPRYHTCDSDMPIYEWRRIFENDSVKIAAGCDILYRSCKDDAIHVNHETLCALAMQYQTNGADYIYLFNHTYLDDFDVYDYLGDTERLATKERRHIVSYQDVGVHIQYALQTASCEAYRYVSVFKNSDRKN